MTITDALRRARRAKSAEDVAALLLAVERETIDRCAMVARYTWLSTSVPSDGLATSVHVAGVEQAIRGLAT